MTTHRPPRVLSTLYRNGVMRFYDLLVDLVSKSLHFSEERSGPGDDTMGLLLRSSAEMIRKQAEKILTVSGDPAEYLSFLTNSYAVMLESAPALGHVSFENRWTQQQIVERVIALQFQQEEKPSHALCSGYRKLRPSVGESSHRRSPYGLESACENSSVDIVNSSSWKLLLSRVGDSIMLHVLTYGSVYIPLPNCCFLQVSGPPRRCVVSMPGKSLWSHPGGKMLGGNAGKKWRSGPVMSQQNQMGRNWFFSRVEDKLKQPVCSAECQADDTTLVAHELKQAHARNQDFSGETSMSSGRNQMLTFTLSAYRKRHRTESIVSGLKIDVVKRQSKTSYFSKAKIGSKRARCGSRQQVRRDCDIVKPPLVDTSSEATFVSVVNVSPKCPVVCFRSLCARRADPGRTCLQQSIGKQGVFDENDNPHPNNLRKDVHLTGKSGKNICSQQENYRCKISAQANPHEIFDKPKISKQLKCAKMSTQDTGCFIQLEEEPINQEIVPMHMSNRHWEDCPAFQCTCASESPVANATLLRTRVRLPSWKRRKLREAEESYQELISKGLAHNLVNNSKLVPSDVPLEICGEGCSMIPIERRRSQYNQVTVHSISGRLIDRTPIFYNSNYSCHAGLPSKHILNIVKPNETGVAHLFSTIFGVHCNLSVCSCSRGHLCPNCSSSMLKAGQSCSLKSIYKLLKELLSNSRRCTFARLLDRHCPLPEGFHPVPKDSQSVCAQLQEPQAGKVEQKGSEVFKAMHKDEQEDPLSRDTGPEVEEIMSLWLGLNHQSREMPTTQQSETPSTSSSEVVQEQRQFNSTAKQTNTDFFETTKQVEYCNVIETPLCGYLRTKNFKHTELMTCYTTHSEVVGFLWAVCRSIIPRDMLGCLQSWRALRSSISHFVCLRRQEKFNVKHALFRLPLSSFSWLDFQCTPNSKMLQISSKGVAARVRELQQRRLELWLYWLFSSLVVPLIRSHFYVTDNENHRQNIFYYRKPVWARICSDGVKELTSKIYEKLSKQAVAQILNSRVLGFSQIRLLPKSTGLRPIANLAASSQGSLKCSSQTKRRAKLCKAFENISKGLSTVKCRENDNRSLSFARPVVPPFTKSRSQYPVADTCISPSSTDAKKTAIAASTPLDGYLKSPAAFKDSSWLPDASTTRRSCMFAKSFNVWKRSRNSVNFSFRSINSVMRDAYCSLKLEKEAHPDDLGSSVFGYCDIHKKVLPFILQLKGSFNGMPRLFMAVCDMTKAYDTIPQDKLQEIVESFVQSSNYKVTRYSCIVPTVASVRIFHGRTCTRADNPIKFIDSVRDLATKRSHCIFVDQSFSTSTRRDQVLAILGDHLKQNIVQIGSHFYQQKVGIPQGSIVSSLLCSLFYGHFDVHSLIPLVQSHSAEPSDQEVNLHSSIREGTCGVAANSPFLTMSDWRATVLPEFDIEQMLELSLEISDKGQDHLLGCQGHIETKLRSRSDPSEPYMPSKCTQHREETGNLQRNSVLLRLIDDSLFISTSEGRAKVFVESMHKGSKEYGCQANQRKTATSFCLQVGNEVLPRKVYQSEDGACFMRWSGLLINCYTLEFQADYTRYCGEHIRSSLTVTSEQNQGLQLLLRLGQFMRPKCHALFFDPRINSPATIRLNVFQAFMLCAMKFHAYVCCLSDVNGGNEPFLYTAIHCAIRYMYGLSRHKMESVGALAGANVPCKELKWLALVAFHRVLKRKQARYQVLLYMLEIQLQRPRYNKLRACPHLSSATDERRSSMFQFIKY